MKPSGIAAAAALFFTPVFTGCSAVSTEPDPIVLLTTSGGVESGVSTDYGVVFLGRTARSGSVSIAAWYADGPGLEEGLVETVGGGLYTTEAEIRLPAVPLAIAVPEAGATVTISGRSATGLWEESGEIVRDERVEGLLLESTRDLRARGADLVGAGVIVELEGRKHLLGLVTGLLRLEGADGDRELITVAGPEVLWRLVTFRRQAERRGRWVYREDVL